MNVIVASPSVCVCVFMAINEFLSTFLLRILILSKNAIIVLYVYKITHFIVGKWEIFEKCKKEIKIIYNPTPQRVLIARLSHFTLHLASYNSSSE